MTAMRDDFSEPVKRILAQRVANRCSNPDCRAQTSGPHIDPAKMLNVGVAAHITAAAPGGPRYSPELTSEERSDASNGLWLCQNCAKLVDNDAKRFSTETLFKWKENAEREAYALIGKTSVSSLPAATADKVVDLEKPGKSLVARIASAIFSALIGMIAGLIAAPFGLITVGGVVLPIFLSIVFGIGAVLFGLSTFGVAAGLGFWVGMISWFCGLSSHTAVLAVRDELPPPSFARDGCVGLVIGSIVGSAITLLIAQSTKSGPPNMLASLAPGAVIGAIAGLFASVYGQR